MKILIVQTGFLGDVVLSTGVIDNLKALYPNSKLYFLTTVLAKDLLVSHPYLEEVFTFDKRKSQSGISGIWKMAQMLRQHKFDQVFSLHKSYRTALLLWLSRIPQRYGFKEAKGQLLYSKTAKRKDLSHEVLRNLAVLRNIGWEPEELSLKLSLKVPTDVEIKVREKYFLPSTGHVIGIAPGSVWATKRWTVEGFAQVARSLQELGHSIILIGGKEDLEIANKIESFLDAKVKNLVGKTSLVESMAVIKNLSLLLTNDSAPLHIASAFNVPTVAVFCATVPEFGFGPWLTSAKVLGVEKLSCRPCARHGSQLCPTGTNACQLELKPKDVVSAIFELLGDSESSSKEISAS